RSHVPVDGLGIRRRRRREIFHQAADGRAQRYDKRVNADINGPAAAVNGELPVLSHAEDYVRGDLTWPECRDGAFPRPEVTLHPCASLGRSNSLKDLRIEGFDVDSDRLDAHLRYLVDDIKLCRRFELYLDRQAGPFADRRAAASHIEGSLVWGSSR